MNFHTTIRAAVVAWLKAGAIDKVYSSPPAEIAPPLVVVGKIVGDEPLCKGDPDAMYSVSVEIWSQSNSMVEGETLSDRVFTRLHELDVLPSAAALLTGVQFSHEDQTYHPDAPGGPVLARPMTFRLLAQSL